MPTTEPTGRRYSANTDTHSLQVSIRHALCHDSMSAMPYPDRVAVTIDGTHLKGCGGNPAALLQGDEWSVKMIDGKIALAGASVTLTFAADGRVSGNTGCNAFNGRYRLTGEGLMIDQVAVTLGACESAVGEQERAFLDVLNHVHRFDIDAQGALSLHAGPGQSLMAIRNRR